MLFDYLPLALTLITSGLMLSLAHHLLLRRHPELGSEKKLPRQLLLFFLTGAAIVLAVIASPASESTRNQVLGIIGICVSGVIALSSTSFVTNFMAAIMLRVTRPFEIGDFVTVGDYFGKVSERGLFDTEIQSENRELMAIPNAMFISNPVKVIGSSGVIIWTEVSLGYDVHHELVEQYLITAAEQAGLSEPYVHIKTLGDYSIVYRVGGLLLNPSTLLTTRSNLNKFILDHLHEAGIQILSPAFNRQIPTPAESILFPEKPVRKRPVEESAAEEVAFDKANEALEKDQAKQEILARMQIVKDLMKEKGSADKTRLEAEIQQLQVQLGALET